MRLKTIEEAGALPQVGVAATAKATAPLPVSCWAKAKAKVGDEASRLCCQGILAGSIARCKIGLKLLVSCLLVLLFLLYTTIDFYLCVIVGEAPTAPYEEADVRNTFQA